jgi:hypothetical protein
MRTHILILTAACCLLLASPLWARPDEPKQEPAGPAPAAAAGKAAEPAKTAEPGGDAATVDKHSDEHLRSRVDQFWKRKIATKYDECYGMLTRNSRDKQTLVSYIQRINTRTTGYKIDSIAPDPANPDHVKVTMVYKLQAMGFKMDNAKQLQDWYFEEGDWFLEYFPKTPFDSKSRRSTPGKTGESAQAAPDGSEGNKEKSSLDPEQKKRLQELLEQFKKSRSSTKPSLDEALAPQESTGKSAASPQGTPGKPVAGEGKSAPADGSQEASPPKKAVNYQTQPRHHTTKTAKTGDAPPKQDPAKTGTPAETPAKQDPAKTGTPVETPAKQDPAKTGGDPKK